MSAVETVPAVADCGDGNSSGVVKKQVVSMEADDMKIAVYFKGTDDERPLGSKSESFSLMSKSDTGYVGLLNQGATCYLNSLLQSLFMTPQFRKAVLSWRYNPKQHGKAEFCIPYQIQLLFARLLLSRRPSVGTKDLTHSFRWNAAESFRQHDIQELMRVLFDAIEVSLGSGPMASFLSDLYEGQIVDYISCPECGLCRERSDKFLDIGLVVQGETTLERALSEFVTPETLSGDNKWRCSGCNEKVEATKGLHFSVLPDILTVQLKRFVYDPIKRGRVKVNARVSFDEELDMTSLLSRSKKEDVLGGDTDGASGSSTCSQSLKYRLFAVLMHSGTATGGHYFAFIKSHHGEKKWVQFNDAVVSYMEQDKEGEPAFEPAFGNANSGVSAYLLMYQRVPNGDNAGMLQGVSSRDKNEVGQNETVNTNENESGGEATQPVRDASNTKVEHMTTSSSSSSLSSSSPPFVANKEVLDSCLLSDEGWRQLIPSEVRDIIDKEDAEWEEEAAEIERKRREMELNILHGNKEHCFKFDLGVTLAHVSNVVRDHLQLGSQFEDDQLRLRMFAADIGLAQRTFSERELSKSLQELGFLRTNCLVLETRGKGEEFPVYNPNEVPLRIKLVDSENIESVVEEGDLARPRGELEGVFTIQTEPDRTVFDLKLQIENVTGIPFSSQRLVRLFQDKAVTYADNDAILAVSTLHPSSSSPFRLHFFSVFLSPW